MPTKSKKRVKTKKYEEVFEPIDYVVYDLHTGQSMPLDKVVLVNYLKVSQEGKNRMLLNLPLTDLELDALYEEGQIVALQTVLDAL